MRCDPFQDEEFEAVLVHVLRLMLVLAEPSERELTNAGPDVCEGSTEVWSFGIAMFQAPRIDVASMVEFVRCVKHIRRSERSRPI